MPCPRTSAKVLELRGAFKKNSQRRRYEIPSRGPMSRKPDANWTPALKTVWRDLLAESPPGLELQVSDRQAFRTMACTVVLCEQSELGTREWLAMHRILLRWFDHFGFTPASRRRLCPP